MTNILYLTRSDFFTDSFAGGVGTKTHAIHAAWSDKGIHKINYTADLRMLDEDDETATNNIDVILIELLGLPRNNAELFDIMMSKLRKFTGPILVYGSDSDIFRWHPAQLQALKEVVHGWIPNCKWQQAYFQDFDIPVYSVVHEPINCDIFKAAEETEKIIIAGGMISYAKNSTFFVALFESLKSVKRDYKTAYIGSVETWNKKSNAANLQIQKAIEDSVDIFHGTLSQERVSTEMSKAAVAVLNPFYETCNRFHMETMACGTPTLCGAHICYDERPVTARFTDLKDCIRQLQNLTTDFTELPIPELGNKEKKFAIKNFSYQASLEQFNAILRRVL